MGWHVLEACQAELAEAAAAAEAGDLDNAVARYWATMHIVSKAETIWQTSVSCVDARAAR